MKLPLQSALKAFSFFKKKREVLGIDIGTYAIKLAYLKGNPGQWSLVRWSVIPYLHIAAVDKLANGHASRRPRRRRRA